MKTKRTPFQTLKTIIQWTMVVLVAFLALVKALIDKGVALPLPEISLHAVCPFGGVVTLYEFLTTGGLVPKLHLSALVLMGLGLVLAFLFGPLFCGVFCPLGTVQEAVGKLGQSWFGKRFNQLVPPSIDRALSYLRYLVLALVVYQTATAVKLVFVDVDPYYALFNFYTGEVALSALILLGLVLLLSLIISRPWCRYLCPYGALLGLFNLIRLFPIRRRVNRCIGCKQCDKACPMGIELSKSKVIRDPRCISCYACLSEEACPVSDTLVISNRKGDLPQ